MADKVLMDLLSHFFRSFINSIIISFLFSLIGISLFVGNFPPTVKQIKGVWAEYKNLLNLKQQLVARSNGLNSEELVEALSKEKNKQLQKLSNSRGEVGGLMYSEEGVQVPPKTGVPTIVPTVDNRAPAATQVAAPVEIPKAWQEQFYQLRTEVFRLNQRVIELERKQSTPAVAPARR